MRRDSHRKEKIRRRNNIIIGIILLFLMTFSLLAVYVSSPDLSSELSYNGYNFEVRETDGGQVVVTTVDDVEYSFYTLPQDAIREIENVTNVELFNANQIILAKEPLAIGESAKTEQIYFSILTYDLQSSSGKIIRSGISQPQEFSNDRIYGCEDASEQIPVVLFKKGIVSDITITQIEDNCYEMMSDTLSLLILRDYVLYKSLGIIA